MPDAMAFSEKSVRLVDVRKLVTLVHARSGPPESNDPQRGTSSFTVLYC